MVSRVKVKREMAVESQDSDSMSAPSLSQDVSSHSANQLSGYGTIKFIETVRDRPEVWDSRSTAYKLKDVKQHAWKCIAAKMDSDYHNLSATEQNVAVHGWMRRWKSLRDCYTREVSRNNTKKKKYIYFDHLSFLNQVVSSKRDSYRRMREFGEEAKEESYMPEDLYSGDLWTGKQFLVVEQDDAPEEILSLQQLAAYHQAQLQEGEEDQPEPVAVFTIGDDDDEEDRSRAEPDRADDSLADDSSSNDRNHEDDSDRMFLLSLIPDMRKIPPTMKLHLKSKILEIIQDAISAGEETDQ